MADDADVTPEKSGSTTSPTIKTTTRKRTAAKKSAPPAEPTDSAGQPGESGTSSAAPAKKSAAKQPAKKAAAKKATAAKAPAKRATAKKASPVQAPFQAEPGAADSSSDAKDSAGDDRSTPPGLVFQPPPAERVPRKRSSKAEQAEQSGQSDQDRAGDSDSGDQGGAKQAPAKKAPAKKTAAKKTAAKKTAAGSGEAGAGGSDDKAGSGDSGDSRDTGDSTDDGNGDGGQRRRRRRGGRRRGRKGGPDADQEGGDNGSDADTSSQGGAERSDGDSGADNDQDSRSGAPGDDPGGDDQGEGGSSSSSRRRRRRRRSGEGGDGSSDDPDNTVTRVRSAKAAEDEITAFTGSTRLEAKKQRRREGREAGRRRAPVISEAEFLARRESVDRAMVIRQRKDLTQIAVLEDKVLVEHYVARESQTSLIGNVYLGKVQNVLPSMEAAFIDIGRGRNAVLYAGEVNWDALGAGNVSGKDRKIEQVLKPGQAVLVQVSKDPIGHKGARLTSQISLPGRFLVYVPEGNTSGISRKLPDAERNRLKNLLKEIVPAQAGVIVRTAAEGAAEEELRHDVARLTARWDDISSKVEGGGVSAPQELYSEPDLTLKVVRDLFTEDFKELVVSGDDAWDMVHTYVEQVAPDLGDRLSKHDDDGGDAFSAFRIDEQINKALERKVWLPSGGSLIIDRTEAMTVVDVNTGKFTGSGGNLEETVTKNNLEAAEEFVRQLRLRDIGGIIVIDFIDMVLESNRELVLRRLIECLGRDRTRHQVAEVTSLGLVQMTRKRIGTGLLEAFSEACEHCQGRGVHVHAEPIEPKKARQDDEPRRGKRGRSGKSDDNGKSGKQSGKAKGATLESDSQPAVRRPSPAEFAAMAAHRDEDEEHSTDADSDDSGDAPDRAPAEATTARIDKDAAETSEKSAKHPVDAGSDDSGSTGSGSVDGESDTDSTKAPEEPPEAPREPVDSTPRIVTSTRRRGANRAAGPPRPGGEPPSSGAAERAGNGGDVEPTEDSSGSTSGTAP